MALDDPIWPDFATLDRLWDSPAGHRHEVAKAAALTSLLASRVEKRPKILIIGPASNALVGELQALKPAYLFQAYPPKVGVRHGLCPAMLMDTDLPPFSRGQFDLVVLSHSLEFRSTPLALLSLAYEILATSGILLTLTPHRLAPSSLCPGRGQGYLALTLAREMQQAAFSPRAHRLLRGEWTRPQSLVSVARPQHPPRRGGGLPMPAMLRGLLRPRATPSVALRRKDA